jgi:hypothetical protein
MVHIDRPVPQGIPGIYLEPSEKLGMLKEHLANLCGMSTDRYSSSFSPCVRWDGNLMECME